MQAVSAEYKESMKSLLRDRGYMRIEFGNVNHAVQTSAELTGDQFGLSNPSKVFENGIDDFVYATFETNFTKIDDSMYFGTNNPNYDPLKEQAFIGRDFVSDGDYQVVISFGGAAMSFNTIVFNFGDNYPVDFSLEDSNGNTYDYQNNDNKIVEINEDFEEVTSVILTVSEMKIHESRLRIYSIDFDYGLEFGNDMIIDSSFESSMSLIDEELPQMNFNAKLINEDHYFDIENPKSIVDQFDTTVEMKIYYGYQLSDRIEWLQAAKLYVKSWGSDQNSFTITGQDILQTNEKKYIYGTTATTSLYDLAEAVFSEMGITEYYIDPDLDTITTKNPIPVVPCKEALQLIANAGCKKLYLQRDGTVKIGDESLTINYEASDSMAFSNLENTKVNDTKYNYAIFDDNYVKVDDSKYFVTSTPSEYKHTGYVSLNYSGSDGVFASGSEPIITVTSQANFGTSGMNIIFSQNYATEFIVKFYFENIVIDEETFTNTERECSVTWDTILTDKVEIVFTETNQPYNRVHIDFLEFEYSYSLFTFDENEIMSYPNFSKAETIQKITVPYYVYQASGTEDKLLEESITVANVNDEITFIFREPVTNLRYVLSSGVVTIVKATTYSVTLKVSVTGSNTITIYGEKYNVVEQEVEDDLNEDGIAVRWSNPLINSKAMAENLLNWLKEYYSLDGSYQFNTRGNPELDVNDEVNQRKYTGELMNVLITDISLNFNGAFSGSVVTLKKGNEA